MKALMSVGALISVLGLLMMIGMIFGVRFHNTVRLVEGYMPMQVLSELATFVTGFTGLSYLANSMGITIPSVLAGSLVLDLCSNVSEVSDLPSDPIPV